MGSTGEVIVILLPEFVIVPAASLLLSDGVDMSNELCCFVREEIMKAATTRINHWTVAADFARTLWVAAGAGLAFSLFVGAVVALIASAG